MRRYEMSILAVMAGLSFKPLILQTTRKEALSRRRTQGSKIRFSVSTIDSEPETPNGHFRSVEERLEGGVGGAHGSVL